MDAISNITYFTQCLLQNSTITHFTQCLYNVLEINQLVQFGTININNGVRQRSILRSLLLLIYINDLPSASIKHYIIIIIVNLKIHVRI